MSVELIYEKGCPGLQQARHALVEALTSLNMTPDWSEWEQSDPGLPDHAKGFGSPTVLVEGRDVAGEAAEAQARSCRLYEQPDGRKSPSPTADLIRDALRKNVVDPLQQAGDQGEV
jgi:mercuric ion transport protein